MKEKKEKQNVSVIAELYTKANQFKEDCEITFWPHIDSAKIRDVCYAGGELLYIIKKFAPTLWEEWMKEFVNLEFPDDFEEQWEDRNWSNIMQLWGHALDIENNLSGGDLDDYFRRNLALLIENGRLKEYESRAEWYMTPKDWIKWFYERTFHILYTLIQGLEIFLKGVDVKENPIARLVLIEQFLRETEFGFFRSAQAIGPYMPLDVDCPSSGYCASYWNDGSVDVDLGTQPGTLRTEVIGGPKIRCSFTPDGDPQKPIGWILEGQEEIKGCNREIYKREVFTTWHYTTGKYLGQWQTDKRAYWFLEDVSAFSAYAQNIL